jgi:hypothetical protein
MGFEVQQVVFDGETMTDSDQLAPWVREDQADNVAKVNSSVEFALYPSQEDKGGN